MEICHLFVFLCGPALGDEGPLHAVEVSNPSEEFLDRLILSSKLRVNVATEKDTS